MSTELLTYIRDHTTSLRRLRIVWAFQKKTNGLSYEPVYYHVREAAGDNVFICEHGYMLITFTYHLKVVADPAHNYEKQRGDKTWKKQEGETRRTVWYGKGIWGISGTFLLK